VGEGRETVRVLAWDTDGEDRVLAAALYPAARASFEEVMASVRARTPDGRLRLVQSLLADRAAHDIPLRALEHTNYTVEMVLDQGGYFELKRHRMMTQTPQHLTTALGFAVPALMVEAGLEAEYRRVMEQADQAFRRMAERDPAVAAYLVPNACNRRVLITANLREIFHFCELRSASNAHFSIRRVALGLAEAVRQVHPALGAYLRLPEPADRIALESEHFAQV
jgi:hypothetical protein